MGIFAILVLFLILFVFVLYLLNLKTKRHFESQGIHYLGNGTFRFIRNSVKGIGFVDSFQHIYNDLKATNAKVAGGVDFGQTTFIIVDPEIIKSVLVKDFDHFVDKRTFSVPKKDYLFAKMIIALKGDRWRALRSKLSPAFTTNKIKRFFPLFNISGKKLAKFVESEMALSPSGEMDLSNGYSKFTMDIIASAVCGFDSKAFDQGEPSLFERMGNKLQIKFGGKEMLKIFLLLFSPKLTDLLGISLFDMEMQDFFSDGIISSIKQREKTGEKRNDFLQLMLAAREDKLKMDESELDNFEKDAQIKDNSDMDKASTADILDDIGVAANCVSFMVAGFDTTQSVLLFVAYALALNQDVQDKLRAEVESQLEENEGELNYESMQKMTYLDMVINETLRYYPPSGATDRNVTKDYKIPGTNYILKKGDAIQIAINGLHHDPDYFPEPEKFDPERFSSENKGKINQYVFLPFGAGPRNCLGMRFALTEVKVAISHLVHNFRIEPSKKTLIPMKYTNASSLKPEGGMFLALHKINH